MYYIDGLLRPRTIKTGVYIRDGMAYYCLGNFVSIITGGKAADWHWL